MMPLAIGAAGSRERGEQHIRAPLALLALPTGVGTISATGGPLDPKLRKMLESVPVTPEFVENGQKPRTGSQKGSGTDFEEPVVPKSSKNPAQTGISPNSVQKVSKKALKMSKRGPIWSLMGHRRPNPSIEIDELTTNCRKSPKSTPTNSSSEGFSSRYANFVFNRHDGLACTKERVKRHYSF